jgi:integrase
LCASVPSGGFESIVALMRSVQVLDRYGSWLDSTALAARSQANYRRWVIELVEDLDAAGELAAFLALGGEQKRLVTLTNWRRQLIDRGLAPATVNLALAAASSLLACHALACPTVARVAVPPGVARALTRSELRALERLIDGLTSARDRAILQVLLRTGLRIGELAALDRRDVEVTQRTGQIVVRHGKGDRYRVVPLSRRARQALKAWLVERAEHPRAPADVTASTPLWLSRSGARLSARTVNAIVANAMNSAGLDHTAHALRHTLATRLVREDGCDLVLVADVLGHQDVKTTARYARSTCDDRRAALERADR